ncbi:hypothetical protein C3K47_08910 [Solitalea longa]|uniref:DUF481 domain-containing protein n=1 Tax=Solitalea longa TaxID=2079460 RepID=A0A2S5A3Q2_9SPHI|nr:DUF481 domain-containing protein [Solitalea longa]POY37166.1 hypothetical protein C3K47_08910 [Solitalea longa]
MRSLFFLCFFLLFSTTVFSQKTDKILLENGDMLTGEIKSMQFAMLTFKTDAMSTINVKWEQVVWLQSYKTCEVKFRWGELKVGRLDSVIYNDKMANLNNVVEITPIKDRFWKRIDGNIDAGFNYTHSSKVGQFNMGGMADYRMPKFETILKASSIISSQPADTSQPLTKKQDASLQFIRLLKNNYSVEVKLYWQQNTALGLKSRVSMQLGGGKDLIYNNHNRLGAGGGIAGNREQSDDVQDSKFNMEAFAGLAFKKFHYSSPKINIDAQLVGFAGLTEVGRFRTEANITAKVEIFTDFFIGLTFYDNFDNRPLSGATGKNDFGIITLLSYSF